MATHEDRECKHHGLTKFILKKQNDKHFFICVKCQQYRSVLYARRIKAELVEHFGGKCKCCGYDKYPGALEFHHLDPTKKDFELGGKRGSFKLMLAEAEKCIMVCSNCHKEIHAGMITTEEIEAKSRSGATL